MSRSRVPVRSLLIALALVGAPDVRAQASGTGGKVTVRLTEEMWKKFAVAAKDISSAIRSDSGVYAALSQPIANDDPAEVDRHVASEATVLEGIPKLKSALDRAGISAKEYVAFAMGFGIAYYTDSVTKGGTLPAPEGLQSASVDKASMALARAHTKEMQSIFGAPGQ